MKKLAKNKNLQEILEAIIAIEDDVRVEKIITPFICTNYVFYKSPGNTDGDSASETNSFARLVVHKNGDIHITDDIYDEFPNLKDLYSISFMTNFMRERYNLDAYQLNYYKDGDSEIVLNMIDALYEN